MSYQTAIRSRALADAALTALVGTHIDWGVSAQGADWPRLTLQTTFEDLGQHFKGFNALKIAIVQIDGWGKSFAAAKAVTDAAIAVLVPPALVGGIQFTRAFVESVRDPIETSQLGIRFRSSVDIRFYFR